MSVQGIPVAYTIKGETMATVQFRIDYAKFLIHCEPDRWQTLYQGLNTLSHSRKYAGEWLKSMKVNRLWYNTDSGMETWSIDIWGEWAGIVELLDPHWMNWLKRLDVRAIVWDATADTILDVGQHLQRHTTSHNINVFNTKKASKRLGRDRGGVGFAIGSHKSDLRITTYKRTGEPVAQEFQCSGAMLSRLIGECREQEKFTSSAYSAWAMVTQKIERQGSQRLMRVLENAGIGTYWPVLGLSGVPGLPPVQSAFISAVQDIIDSDTSLLEPPPPDESQR